MNIYKGLSLGLISPPARFFSGNSFSQIITDVLALYLFSNPNMKNLRQVGTKGEVIAERFLLKKGYQLIDKNKHCRYGEIDLIMKDADEVIFFEVKYRNNEFFGKSVESITQKKKVAFQKAIESYLLTNPIEKWRADFLGINPKRNTKSTFRILHIKNFLN
jgi:putative endonuclease